MKKKTYLGKAIALFAVVAVVIALVVSCSQPTNSGGGGAISGGSDTTGGSGTTGGKNAQITINLPPIGSTAIRSLTDAQVSRLQRETAKYRVIFSGLGQTIPRDGDGTTFSAVFPVGAQVSVTVYCLNKNDEVIVKTVTKTVTISSGTNSLSFKLSEDGEEIIPERDDGGSGGDEKPDDTDKEPEGDDKDDDDDDDDDNDTPSGGDSGTTTPTEQVYTLTLNLNGGSWANASDEKTQYKASDLPLTLPTPTKASTGVLPISFAGWYTEPTFVNKVTEIAQGSTGEKRFYAKWIEFTMVSVTGDETFTMGDNTDSYSDNDEWDGVTVSSFKMGKYEVTQDQWKAVMGSLPSSSDMASTDKIAGINPVTGVLWYDAIMFCNKLSLLEKKTPCYSINNETDPEKWGDVPTGVPDAWANVTCDWAVDGYRLPTEAEWEYAARGGSKKDPYKYSGSDTIDEVAWYSDNSGRKTHEVGTAPVKENALGISDMSGNVWEWCWDRYGSIKDGYDKTTTSDPKGPDIAGLYRVLRGGSCDDVTSYCSVAFRRLIQLYNRYDTAGLRVVCRQQP